MTASPIILALDFSDMKEAERILSLARPHIGMIKIGLEMFAANGCESFSLAKDFKLPVFLDLKLHDVPTTVAKTIAVFCEKLATVDGDHFLSVHPLGGKEMCRAALNTAQNSNVSIAAVAILSSVDRDDLRSFNIKGAPGTYGSNVSIEATDCFNDNYYHPKDPNDFRGIKHLICSPSLIKTIDQYVPDGVTYICPGIRNTYEEDDDHKRAMTPGAAIKNGADWLVIGRPITKATDPAKAASYILEQANKGK